MKKFLTFLGGVFLIIIILVIGLAIFMGVQLGPADEEAKAYARESIEAIATVWDADAVYERSSDTLKETLNQGEVVKLMTQGARAVGDLEKLGEVTCSTNISTTTGDGKVITSECSASAEHQRGTVDYRINVQKRNDAWAVNGFHFTVTATEESATEV